MMSSIKKFPFKKSFSTNYKGDPSKVENDS